MRERCRSARREEQGDQLEFESSREREGIKNQLTVDGNGVNSEDSRDLSDDTSSSSLDSVGVQDSGDVVGLEVVHVDELVRVLPDGLEVGSLGEKSSL